MPALRGCHVLHLLLGVILARVVDVVVENVQIVGGLYHGGVLSVGRLADAGDQTRVDPLRLPRRSLRRLGLVRVTDGQPEDLGIPVFVNISVNTINLVLTSFQQNTVKSRGNLSLALALILRRVHGGVDEVHVLPASHLAHVGALQ